MQTLQLPSLEDYQRIARGQPTRRYRTPSRRGPLEDNPDVAPVLVDGNKAVSVSLSGRTGTGKSFLLDPADWHNVSSELGARWLLVNNGKPRADGSRTYTVASGRSVTNPHAHQSGNSPVLGLSRHLMGVEKPWEFVRHRNGNRLDLRRCNLFVDDRGLEWERAKERREARAAASKTH